MYGFFHGLLADKKGGMIFTLFGGWHFFYLVLTVITAAAVLLFTKDKGQKTKDRIAGLFLDLAFGLYLADFFLMPLAYGEIDIEKLPFHVCTATCVACFLSTRVKFLEKYRTSIVKLGFLSNLVYLIYPAGVMWHAVGPLSYRVIQTLLFHCLMTVFGFLTLAFDRGEKKRGKHVRDLTVIVCMTVWAVIGNYVYNGTAGDDTRFYNWFFVVRDPFYLLPEKIAPFVMPFLNAALFFAVEKLVDLVFGIAKRGKQPVGKNGGEENV